MTIEKKTGLVDTGVAAFNDVLGGGLPANRVYLLHGSPGSGKTTLALQFLLQGARQGEKALYITLSETKLELEAVALSHGFSLAGIDIFESIAAEEELQPENQYTMYQPSDIELNVTTKAILDAINEVKPRRVVIDSLSELKLLAQNALRFRRQILALKQYFSGRDCTVLMLDDKTSTREEDMQLESIAHGVISLEQLSPDYGAERRRIRVTKIRGQRYRGGFHDFTIARGGLNIFPRIVASEHSNLNKPTFLKSGVAEMDDLLGGGIDTGTSVLLLGPAGVGKSTLSVQYAAEAARQGKRSAIFTFDERIETMIHRAAGLGIPLKEYIDNDLIEVRPIDPTELSPGEFAHSVRQVAEGADGKGTVKIVVIDSLNGYLNAMPEERFLTAQMHELLTYLGHKDIVTFLVVAQHGLLGNAMQTPIDTSYLADTVILFRYFESNGEVRQLISVMKKRSGQHERSIREIKFAHDGVKIGEPLRQFHGLLTGTPVFKGNSEQLLETGGD